MPDVGPRTRPSSSPLPARYRKRPVVVEAVQWDGDNWETVLAFTGRGISQHGRTLSISTREGTMTASPGDFIIRGVAGELYPCKPDIFDQTYEAVDA